MKHTKGCQNVVNRFRNINGKKGDLYDGFGVGMVDKDKVELDYLKECDTVFVHENLILWKYPERPHYIIQLNPPLEHWVIQILGESGININECGYSNDFKKLKKEIKGDIDNETDEKLGLLVNRIINSNHAVVEKLKTILLYLKDKNLESNPEELKQKLLN
ncbi:MAG: hypothetical protein ABJC98_09970 [Bacteroidota bacterium]